MKNVTVLIYPESEYYQVTLRKALKICQYFDSDLNIVAISPDSLLGVDKEKFMDMLKNKSKLLLGKQYHSINISYEVGFGRVIPVLSDIIETNQSDLMVVGTVGNNLLFNLLYDSDSVDIAQALPCPVLLVPPRDVDRRIKRIVYNTHFAFDNINALNILEDWATIFKSEILCLHVCSKENDVAEAKQKLADLNKRFPAINFQFKVLVGDVVDKIYEHLSLQETDLIVTMHNKRSWWANVLKPSLTEEIASYAKIPMLVFKKK